jgi:hypothetical protein
MAAHEFRIKTRWTVEGQIADVARILTDVARFPEWWGQVYLDVKVLDPGDLNGPGQSAAVHSKGWLPYHLNWVGTMVADNRPHGWEIIAKGDLNGHGVWALEQHGASAQIDYDWRVSADRPLFRLLSPLLAPVFAWNHRWAMARGEAGLRAELRRPGAAAIDQDI